MNALQMSPYPSCALFCGLVPLERDHLPAIRPGKISQNMICA